MSEMSGECVTNSMKNFWANYWDDYDGEYYCDSCGITSTDGGFCEWCDEEACGDCLLSDAHEYCEEAHEKKQRYHPDDHKFDEDKDRCTCGAEVQENPFDPVTYQCSRSWYRVALW